MNKKCFLDILIISLLGIGAISSILFLYDYSTSLHLISKKEVFKIASQKFACPPVSMNDKTPLIELLHVKNNTLYAVDETTMQDMALTGGYDFREHPKSEYVYEIGWNCIHYSLGKPIVTTSIVHYMDAKNGEILG